MMIFRWNKSVIAFIILSIVLFIFFKSVNLSQKQAVGSMFICIFAGLGYWFWKKPWR